MSSPKQKTYRITWQNIEIDVRHSPSKHPECDRVYGYALDHIEVVSVEPERAPLSITETGYRSIFITAPEIAEFGSPVAYVMAYLKSEALKPEWIAAKAASDQFDLF